MSGSKIWYCINCGYEVEHRGRCHRCKARLVSSPLVPLSGLDEDDEVAYRLGDWSAPAHGRLIVALIRANVEHRFDEQEDELIVAADDEDKVDDLLEELQAVLAVEGIEVVVENDEDEEEDEDEDEDEEEGGDEDEEEEDEGGERAESGTHREVDATDGSVPVDGSESDDSPSALQPEESSPLTPTEAALELLYDAAKRLRTDPTDMQADGDVAEASAGVFADDDALDIDEDTWAAIGRVTRRLLGALGADEALEDEIRTQAGVLAKLLQPYVILSEADLDPRPSTTAQLLAESTAALPQGRFDHGRDLDEEILDEEGDEGDEAEGEDADQEGAEGDGAGDQDGRPDHDDRARVFDREGDGDREEDGDRAAEGGDSAEGDTDGEDVRPGEDTSESAEVVYELPDWLPEQRANLSVLLDEESIAHSWDGGDLVVAAVFEGEVDAIFDRIEAQEPVADGEERYRAIEELFASADRLSGDPDSTSRRDDLRVAFRATDGPSPLGMPDALWWQIRARARTLTDDLDTGAASSRIREDAAALRDLLRNVV